jgi:uncharacterized protein YndB with AHSA1/START domain
MKIESTIEIAKPPSEVFAFLVSDENLPLWILNLIRSERIEGDDATVGTITNLIYEESGKRVILEEEVVAVEENKSIEAILRHSRTEILLKYRLEELDEERTRLHSSYEYQPKSLLFKMYLSLNKGYLTDRYQNDLVRLKDAIESLSDEFEELEEED